MLVDVYIDIRVKNCRKLNYFESLGYDISGEFIRLKVSDLNPGSRELINVKCDFCDKETKVTYKEYCRNISNGGKYACSKYCGSLKAKDSNLQNWGVEYPMMSKDVQNKTKKTNLEKYGVEYLQQSKDIREKSKKTIQEKWGVDHISKTDYFKDKFKETCLEKFGVEYPMMNQDVKSKFKETLLENWNVDNPSKSKDIQDIIKYNNLKKWGVYHPSQVDAVKFKIKQTKLEKYGNENYNNIDKLKKTISNFTDKDWIDIIDKIKKTKFERWGTENYNNIDKIKETISNFTEEEWSIIVDKRRTTNIQKSGVDNVSKDEKFRSKFDICKDQNYIKYISDSESLFKCDLDKNHEFLINSDNYFHRKKINIPICTICYPISESKSIKEIELYEFIKSVYSGQIFQSYRDGLEIDIYLPELNLGFEFNGLYWHSDLYKDRNYHLVKSEHFKEKGIKVIHIWEDDWDFRKEIIQSQIKNWLGLNSNKIFARDCTVIELSDTKIIKDFLNQNHIQGSVNSKIKIGLFFNSELVSLMTFNQFEGRKKMKEYEWNLNRFCNKRDCSVIGGASKLLSYFIKKYYPTKIISYADKDWSTGNLYEKLDFKKLYETNPDYKYIVNSERINKSRFRKSFTGVSESKLDLLKIWDCGKIKFELKI